MPGRDLLGPDGQPAKPRQPVINHRNVALRVNAAFDGQVTVEGPDAVYELGEGDWFIVAGEAWLAIRNAAMGAAGPPTPPMLQRPEGLKPD